MKKVLIKKKSVLGIGVLWREKLLFALQRNNFVSTQNSVQCGLLIRNEVFICHDWPLCLFKLVQGFTIIKIM